MTGRESKVEFKDEDMVGTITSQDKVAIGNQLRVSYLLMQPTATDLILVKKNANGYYKGKATNSDILKKGGAKDGSGTAGDTSTKLYSSNYDRVKLGNQQRASKEVLIPFKLWFYQTQGRNIIRSFLVNSNNRYLEYMSELTTDGNIVSFTNFDDGFLYINDQNQLFNYTMGYQSPTKNYEKTIDGIVEPQLCYIHAWQALIIGKDRNGRFAVKKIARKQVEKTFEHIAEDFQLGLSSVLYTKSTSAGCLILHESKGKLSAQIVSYGFDSKVHITSRNLDIAMNGDFDKSKLYVSDTDNQILLAYKDDVRLTFAQDNNFIAPNSVEGMTNAAFGRMVKGSLADLKEKTGYVAGIVFEGGSLNEMDVVQIQNGQGDTKSKFSYHRFRPSRLTTTCNLGERFKAVEGETYDFKISYIDTSLEKYGEHQPFTASVMFESSSSGGNNNQDGGTSGSNDQNGGTNGNDSDPNSQNNDANNNNNDKDEKKHTKVLAASLLLILLTQLNLF